MKKSGNPPEDPSHAEPSEPMARIRNMFMSPDKFPEPSPSSASYNQVLRSAELAQLMLVGAEFLMKPSFFGIDLGSEDKADLVLDYELNGVSLDRENGIISGVFRWVVTVSEKGAKPGEEAFFASASYYLAYDSISLPEDESAAKMFLGRVGKFATYPYFRAHVSHLSWESGAEIPVLPIIKG